MVTKIHIGCHVSISGSIAYAFDRAVKLGCNTFQIFVKNPRGWKARKIPRKEIEEFHSNKQRTSIDIIFAHLSYLPNLASFNSEIYDKSINSFFTELTIASKLNIPYFIVHCGSYKDSTLEQGIRRFADSILLGLERVKNLTILIENTAGGKNSFGGDFTLIAKVLNEIGDIKRVKTCIDTAHAFAAGYDLRTASALEKTLEALDSTIGLGNISVFHTNDSKYPLGSHRDRHEHIGLGEIGEEGFKAFASHPFCRRIPWILETPVNQIRSDKDNINLLLKFAQIGKN
ncbi:MAG: deoxyribonuclease IV [Candidatus Heimdallarchaeaceae archaeon]